MNRPEGAAIARRTGDSSWGWGSLAAAYTEQARLVDRIDSCARVCTRQLLRGHLAAAAAIAAMMLEHETDARDLRATLADVTQPTV